MSVNRMSKKLKKGVCMCVCVCVCVWGDRCLTSGNLELEQCKARERWIERQRGRKTELQAGETVTGVQTEMSDESEAFWEDAPV